MKRVRLNGVIHGVEWGVVEETEEEEEEMYVSVGVGSNE